VVVVHALLEQKIEAEPEQEPGDVAGVTVEWCVSFACLVGKARRLAKVKSCCVVARWRENGGANGGRRGPCGVMEVGWRLSTA